VSLPAPSSGPTVAARCPSCHAAYTNGERFCSRDGARLIAKVATAAIVSLPAGQLLDGRFRVLRQIGEGGMSVVYLASDEQMGTEVAIKLLAATLSKDLKAMARLRREAAFGVRMAHPNVCHILRLGTTPDGSIYIVMPFLDGELLCDRVNRLGHLSLDETVSIVREVALGLHSAHELGIVHRDLKPENVMLVRDTRGERAVVLDFGLAKARRPGPEMERLTATGVVLGTPEFMSPEQLRARPLDGRSDLYALAVMASEMLTGKLPFFGRTQQEIMLARLRQGPIPIRRLRPELQVPEAVEAVLMRAMEREPEKRFANTPQFADALMRAASRSQPLVP
jgi:eukaryotic-like serine/threonine-protein kinase